MPATNFNVNICPVPTVTPAVLPTGQVGQAYPATTIGATGGTAPYVAWAIVAGALPAGLSFNTATGQITGTPTGAGTFNFTVQVTDTAGQTDTENFSIVVSAQPIPTLDNAPANGICWTVGETMQFSVTSGQIDSIVPTAPLTGVASGLGTANATFQITGGTAGTTHNVTVNNS